MDTKEFNPISGTEKGVITKGVFSLEEALGSQKSLLSTVWAISISLESLQALALSPLLGGPHWVGPWALVGRCSNLDAKFRENSRKLSAEFTHSFLTQSTAVMLGSGPNLAILKVRFWTKFSHRFLTQGHFSLFCSAHFCFKIWCCVFLGVADCCHAMSKITFLRQWGIFPKKFSFGKEHENLFFLKALQHYKIWGFERCFVFLCQSRHNIHQKG